MRNPLLLVGLLALAPSMSVTPRPAGSEEPALWSCSPEQLEEAADVMRMLNICGANVSCEGGTITLTEIQPC
jgi:hypothetical protein